MCLQKIGNQTDNVYNTIKSIFNEMFGGGVDNMGWHFNLIIQSINLNCEETFVNNVLIILPCI